MATRAQWIEGARPRTLPAAIAPVAAGSGAAADLGGFHLGRALLALAVSLALQVAVNFANDYSDGVRGTDDARVGPFRLTGSGAARPGRVKLAAFACFAFAGVAGLALVLASRAWWLLPIGALAVAAAWFYTGGSHPYGYLGLGELFVFVFFGLVAVLGTMATQAGRLSWVGLAAAVAIGCLACAILVANNLRDIPTDAAAGKRTLAVRLDDARARSLYYVLMVVPFALIAVLAFRRPAVLVTAAAALLAWPAVQGVRHGKTGLALIPVLRDTGRTELAFGVLLGLTLAVG